MRRVRIPFKNLMLPANLQGVFDLTEASCFDSHVADLGDLDFDGLSNFTGNIQGKVILEMFS